jgi:hypothetical protein
MVAENLADLVNTPTPEQQDSVRQLADFLKPPQSGLQRGKFWFKGPGSPKSRHASISALRSILRCSSRRPPQIDHNIRKTEGI